MQNNNSPITEIILGMLAVLFIAGGVFLLYVGKIDFAGATLMFGFPAALFGVNQALKAPSPSQQAQLIAQHNSLQDLMSQVLNALPALFQKAGAQPPVVVNVAHPADVPTQAQPAVQVSPTGINPVSSSAPVQQQQFKTLNFPTDTAPLAALGKAPQ